MSRTEIEAAIATLIAERDREWALCGRMEIRDHEEDVYVEHPAHIGNVAKLNGRIAALNRRLRG